MQKLLRRVGGLTTLGAVLAVLAFSGIAAADPWGTGGTETGEHPDPGPHTWCYGPSWPAGNNTAGYAESNLANQTYAGPSYQATCNLDGSSQTDVKWGTDDLAGGDRGQARCAVLASSGNCDRNNVTIDFPQINIGDNDEADQWKTTCHELGHTTGLTHGVINTTYYDDCMMSGEIPGTATKWHQYNGHHINHINAWFQ